MSRFILVAFFALYLMLPVAQAQQADSSAGDWMRQTEDGVELLFRGRVLNPDGSLAEGVRMQVIDHPNPLTNNPRSRDVSSQHGNFAFGSIGLSTLFIWASNADGTQQALRLIPKNEVAAAARSESIDLQLEPAQLLAVNVRYEGRPVDDAQVLVRAAYGLEIAGETGNGGLAKIYLPEGQLPNDVRAWTPDRRLGFIDFRNTSDRDRKKTLHTLELSDCKPLTVRVVNEQGVVEPGLPIRLGVSNSAFEWVNDVGLFEAVTDDRGEATFDYFPNWEEGRHFLYVDDSQRFVQREPQVLEGINVCTLNSYATPIDASYQLQLPDQCPGGMVIEGWSFQSVEDHRSTVFFSRVDASGRFSAPVVPGYTYNLFINDDVWVSKPMATILADPESRAALPLDFEIVRGAEVTVTLTAGPQRIPLAQQWVHLETPHHFEWKEDGKTRSGSGGRRWQMIADANGEVHTRAYPGPQLRAAATTWLKIATSKPTSSSRRINQQPASGLLDALPVRLIIRRKPYERTNSHFRDEFLPLLWPAIPPGLQVNSMTAAPRAD